MTYKFRLEWETLWFVLVTALVPALQALASITGIADLTPNFLDGILAAMIRAGVGAVLAVIGGQVIAGGNVVLDRTKE